MVFAFFIQSFNCGHSEILYSQVFSNQSFQVYDSESSLAEDSLVSRQRRKLALKTIADRVAIEYDFLRHTSVEKSAKEAAERLRSDGVLPEFIGGSFRLTCDVTPHLERAKHVVWCGALGCTLTLVLEEAENRIVAEAAVKLVAKYVQNYVRILNDPKEVVSKPDYVAVILKHFLPNGQLLFMNHRLIKQTEKELERNLSLLSSK